MVKVLFWNCRGIANSPTKRYLHRLVALHTPDLIFIAEPRSPTFFFRFLDELGYNTFLQSPSSPFSVHNHSPLWCVAKPTPSNTVIHLNSSPHHLTLFISNQISGRSYLIIGVHAPCDTSFRRSFWNSLLASSQTSTAWGFIGDFNVVLDPSKRWSRAGLNSATVRHFHEFLSSGGLLDIGYSSSSFTWSNNSEGRRFTAARLDRMLINKAWLDNFHDPLLTHLARHSSDHNPILLSHKAKR